MKNIVKFFGFVVFIAAIVSGVSLTSCDNGTVTGDQDLSGTIVITPHADGLFVNKELTANYSGNETVSYQWKKGGTVVGDNLTAYTPTEKGSYTVTVSAVGCKSKTSNAVSVTADPDPNNGDENIHLFEYSEENGAITITRYYDQTNKGNVIIPSQINGKPVTSIGTHAFASCSFTSITIPNSVISIGEQAFGHCSFTSITIGNSVTSIGRSAFAACNSLTSITIPNSVISIGKITHFT